MSIDNITTTEISTEISMLTSYPENLFLPVTPSACASGINTNTTLSVRLAERLIELNR